MSIFMAQLNEIVMLWHIVRDTQSKGKRQSVGCEKFTSCEININEFTLLALVLCVCVCVHSIHVIN
jgi:hypothetical protein